MRSPKADLHHRSPPKQFSITDLPQVDLHRLNVAGCEHRQMNLPEASVRSLITCSSVCPSRLVINHSLNVANSSAIGELEFEMENGMRKNGHTQWSSEVSGVARDSLVERERESPEMATETSTRRCDPNSD